MRLQFLQFAVVLSATLLGSASGSLLRGDQAIRNPRLLGTKDESAPIERAGKKSDVQRPAASKKTKREKEETEGEGDDLPISSEMAEKGENHIVHSHHPRPTSSKGDAQEDKPEQIVQSHHPHDDEETSEKEKKDSKSKEDEAKQPHDKDEIHVPADKHKEKGAVALDNVDTSSYTHVLTRASETQSQTFYTNNGGQLSTIVSRPIEVLAIEYKTRSPKLPTEVEILYLVHMTEHLLTTMYSRSFENTETVHYEGMEVQKYKALGPRLIQFEVSTLFQQKEGAVVPSLDQVKDVVQQGFSKTGDFYSEYLTILEQMPFEIFSTTTSFHVITNANELQSSIDKASGDDDKPKVVLIVAAIITGLSVCVCAVAWFRSAKKSKAKFLKANSKRGFAMKTTVFRTPSFDEPIMRDGYFVDEADLENAGTNNLVELNWSDEYNKARRNESESEEERMWTSDEESSSVTSNNDEENTLTSDESEQSRDSVFEGSTDSTKASPPDWSLTKLKHVEPPTSARITSYPGANEKNATTQLSLLNCDKPAEGVDERKALVQNASPTNEISVRKEGYRIPLAENQTLHQRQPIKTISEPSKDLPVVVSEKNEMLDTRGKAIPLWLQKRQEIMKKREQRSVQNDEEQPSVDHKSFEPSTDGRSSGMMLGPQDKLAAKDTTGQVYHGHANMSPDQTAPALKDSSKVKDVQSTRDKAVPLWVQRRKEILKQSEQSEQQPVQKIEEKPLVELTASESPSDCRSSTTMSPPADDQLCMETNKERIPSEPVPVCDEASNPTGKPMTLRAGKRQDILKQSEQLREPNDEEKLQESLASVPPQEEKDHTPTTASPTVYRKTQSDSTPGEESVPIRDKREALYSKTASAVPLWMQKRKEVMQLSKEQQPSQNDEGNTSVEQAVAEQTQQDRCLSAPDCLAMNEVSAQVGPAHIELIPSIPLPVPTYPEAVPDKTENTRPLWLQKLEETEDLSATHPSEHKGETPMIELGTSESEQEEQIFLTLSASDLRTPKESPVECAHATEGRNTEMIETEPTATTEAMPLWMQKRQEIMAECEDESVCHDDLDEEPPTVRPAWMTRFKQVDKDA